MEFDKIQIISEKKYTFDGLFDVKDTYDYLKEFLEKSRHYVISERDFAEKNQGGDREITSISEAEQEWNDYYKIVLKYQLELKGKDTKIQVNKKKTVMLSKGTGTLTINVYIVPDFNKIRPKSPFFDFLDKIYSKFFREDELEKCKDSAAADVDELLNRFKQQMNSILL